MSYQKDPDELLTWLCWCHAIQGRDNYPPVLQAARCASGFTYDDVEERLRGFQYEHGVHAEKYMQSVDFFRDMENMGYDPKYRAEYEHADLQERADGELPELTWEWYDDPTHDVTEWPNVR